MSAALHLTAREAAAETLALTLWGEAAARPVRAIEALAALVMNRAQNAEHIVSNRCPHTRIPQEPLN